MTFKSKKKLIELTASLGWFVGYAIYAFSSAAPAADNLQGWAIALLVSLGISIGVIIAIEIIFHVIAAAVMVKKEDKSGNNDKEAIKAKIKDVFKEDEMDKKIDTKANMLTLSFMGIGIFGALIALACGVSAVIGLHIILGFSCFFGMSVGCIYSIIAYEKGVK